MRLSVRSRARTSDLTAIARAMPTVSSGTIAISRQDAVKRHVLGLKEKLRAGTATKLPISEIVVGDRIIPEDRNVVGQLVTSIKRIGQTTPILVRLGLDGKKILVDGLNRIAALKQLGELARPASHLGADVLTCALAHESLVENRIAPRTCAHVRNGDRPLGARGRAVAAIDAAQSRLLAGDTASGGVTSARATSRGSGRA